MRNPQEVPYDDTVCVFCGEKLPDEVKPDSPEYEGVCTPCWLATGCDLTAALIDLDDGTK